MDLQAIAQTFRDVSRQGERYVAKENVLHFERLRSDLQVPLLPESGIVSLGCGMVWLWILVV